MKRTEVVIFALFQSRVPDINLFKVVRNNEEMVVSLREFNIMDTMISMMEKYTDHLEDIVAERTAELAAEKAKTDELLYRMLPKYDFILYLISGEGA